MASERSTNPDNHVIIIGSGIAGLSAAVSAAEMANGGPRTTVTVIDRATPADAGGLTKWTSAYLRLEQVDDPGTTFVDDIVKFSDGRTPSWYPEFLVKNLPETMAWVQGHGARFAHLPTYFISSARPRLQPVGGGQGLLDALLPAAKALGVNFRYETTAQRLIKDEDGRVIGVDVESNGKSEPLFASAIIIASGGFEGDPGALDRELGIHGRPLIRIAPGLDFNQGEGISMALDAGTARSGEWQGFHAEPVDPRSEAPESLIMVYPYGILVNKNGERFIDEGRGTVDETYEETARAVWDQPDGIAYLITDRKHKEIEKWSEGLLSEVPPITATSLAELADALSIPAEVFCHTVDTYNASVTDGAFRWQTLDGLHTDGLTPEKSNWALPINEGPYIAYPVSCAIVFTYGGLKTNDAAQAVNTTGEPVPGLYAAGECTGIYHGKYPGGTSVLRSMVFGRVAGQHAVTNAGLLVAGDQS